jgi:hypothetical protein
MRGRGKWSTERDQELKHLRQAERYIAEVNNRIARQRALVQMAINKGRRSIEAVSLLSALEASRRELEKHRQVILDLLENGGVPELQARIANPTAMLRRRRPADREIGNKFSFHLSDSNSPFSK